MKKGSHHKTESIEKIKEKRKLQVCSEETREKMRLKRLDWKWSDDVKRKIRENQPRYCPIGSEFITLKDGNLRVYIKTPDGWRLRARYVMEQVLGRKLESWETVHHKDENTLNDNPSNLEVMTRGEHMKLHDNFSNYHFKEAA